MRKIINLDTIMLQKFIFTFFGILEIPKKGNIEKFPANFSYFILPMVRYSYTYDVFVRDVTCAKQKRSFIQYTQNR